MNNSLVIFLRALAIYMVLTLPALAILPMYIISLIYACTYGWIAWFVFTLVYTGLQHSAFSIHRVFAVLAFAILIGVLLAFQSIEILKSETNIWQSGSFLLFPCAAVVAGWISLYVSREDVKLDFMIEDLSKEEEKEA